MKKSAHLVCYAGQSSQLIQCIMMDSQLRLFIVFGSIQVQPFQLNSKTRVWNITHYYILFSSTYNVDLQPIHFECNIFELQLPVTSGARYSGVPQKVLVVRPYVMSSLHRPKSAILMCPSLSSSKFSSFRSLYMIPSS